MYKNYKNSYKDGLTENWRKKSLFEVKAVPKLKNMLYEISFLLLNSFIKKKVTPVKDK